MTAGAEQRSQPKRIDFVPEYSDRSGVSVQYTRRRNAVHVSGWYDTFVSIPGGEMHLADFLDRLGITAADISRAYREQAATRAVVAQDERKG